MDPWLRNANVVCSEFSADQSQRQGWNALGLRHLNSGHTVTVVSGNAGNRYRVQSNDGLSSTLVVSRLIDRSRSKKEESVGTTIGQNHIRLVHQRIDDHFAARQKINRITVSKYGGNLSTSSFIESSKLYGVVFIVEHRTR